MAKKNTLEETANKNAVEHIFCMINEREIFALIETLIDSQTQSSSEFQDLHFRVTGYNLLNILIEHVQRSQIQEFQAEYLALTRDRLTSKEADLPV